MFFPFLLLPFCHQTDFVWILSYFKGQSYKCFSWVVHGLQPLPWVPNSNLDPLSHRLRLRPPFLQVYLLLLPPLPPASSFPTSTNMSLGLLWPILLIFPGLFPLNYWLSIRKICRIKSLIPISICLTMSGVPPTIQILLLLLPVHLLLPSIQIKVSLSPFQRVWVRLKVLTTH